MKGIVLFKKWIELVNVAVYFLFQTNKTNRISSFNYAEYFSMVEENVRPNVLRDNPQLAYWNYDSEAFPVLLA